MVKFEPHVDKKGMSALNVSAIRYNTANDPRCNIAQKILDEFDFEIPCIAWMGIAFGDMKEVYNYLRAERDNDDAEMKRISDEYELEKVQKNEHISCIAAGGYYLWEYDKEQMRKNEYFED